MQETFLNAFRAIGTFRRRSSLYTWLYRIAANQALMRLRQRGRSYTVPMDDLSSSGLQQEGGLNTGNARPDVLVYSGELGEFLDRCIRELPARYRHVYLLKDVKELSEDRVCQILRISKSTMKSRAHRARTKVRDQFERLVGPNTQPTSICSRA